MFSSQTPLKEKVRFAAVKIRISLKIKEGVFFVPKLVKPLKAENVPT